MSESETRLVARVRRWRLENVLNALDRARADLRHAQRFDRTFGGRRAEIGSAQRRIGRLRRKRDKLQPPSENT